jgi:arylsulfatase A-like enzyme
MTESPFGTMAAAARQWTGTHRSEGILLLTGPPIQPGQIEAPATMQDLAPTILHLLGLPIPKVMDGRTMEEMLRPQFTNTHPIRYDEANGSHQKVGDAEWGSPDEEEQIKERLRSLGYLE